MHTSVCRGVLACQPPRGAICAGALQEHRSKKAVHAGERQFSRNLSVLRAVSYTHLRAHETDSYL
eukprot:4789461-Pleurochrysis_carterae.AAC.1